LEGKVYRRSFLTSDTNGVMEFIPYAKVMAVNGTDTIVRYADALGFYSFNLRASLTWKLGALDQERETWVEGPNFDRPLNLVIEDYAGVFGIVNTDAPRGDLLGLMVKSDGEPIGKANFISAPTGTLGYYFPHIPTGDYKIFIAATGKVSNTTPELKVQRNIKYDRNISFAADTITLVDSTSIFNFVTTGSQSIQGDVEILFPEQKIVSLGGSTTMAASDLVVFNVYPKESKYLPLLNKFWLKGQTLDIKWEFSHTNSTIHTLQSPEDSLSLFLTLTEDVDSAFIYYKIEEGLYKKVKHASFSGKLDFKIGGFTASSKNIEYYFEVYRGQDFYANTNRVYSSTIQYTASYIRLLHQYGDTLYVPQSKDVDVYVSAFKGNWEPADLPLASVWNLKSGIGSVTPDSLGIGAKCNLVEDGVIQIYTPGQNDSLMIPFKVGKFNPHVVDLFVAKNKVYPGETIEVQLMGIDTVQNLKFPLQGEITVEPPHAAKVLGTSLILDSLYPSTLFLNGRYLQNIVSTSVQVQIPIEKDAPRKVYQIDSTLSLFLPESLLLERDFVLLELRQDSIVSPALFEKQWNLKHQPFTLQFPLGGTLNKAPQFYWSENDTNQVRLYNQKTQVVTTFSEPLVTARIFGSDFGWTNDTLHLTQFYPWYYLLEEKESELKTELSILPNPFSPEIIAYNDGNDDFGTKISFFVDAPGQQKVLVDLKIYNMRGEKVRSLLKLESFSKGEYAEYWDGLTDQKRYARNGRYIVYLKSYKPGTKSTLQEVWKYVVLFK
jgi:hypothetical protein